MTHVLSPISFETATKVAKRVAGREPFSRSYLAQSVHADFLVATAQAERLIEPFTGLQAAGNAESVSVSRDEWAQVNMRMFQRMLAPLFDRLGEQSGGVIGHIGRHMAGAQIGTVLGWMSTRVLGQYDMLYDASPGQGNQDVVYYVVPNILALEKRYAFPPTQFRLWIALHECTHRAQFTGVPWMVDHFRSLVNDMLDSTDFDSTQIAEMFQRMRSNTKREEKDASHADENENESDTFATEGVLSFFGNEKQLALLQRMMGLMALLEGHGEVVMSRAGKELVPEAARFHRVMKDRRKNANVLTKFFQQALGLDIKLKQYAQGESFIHYIEQHKSEAFFRQVWDRPENLPTMNEIRKPQLWIDRMSQDEVLQVQITRT